MADNLPRRTDKQVRAFDLTLRGLSLRAVSAQMQSEGYENVSHETVRKLIRTEAAEPVTPLAAQLRVKQHERLEQMRQAATEVLERRNQGGETADDGIVLAALDRLMKVEERQSRLHGLDASQNAELSATIEPRPVELEALLEQARARAVEEEAGIRGEGA